jgi:hypothetical protein
VAVDAISAAEAQAVMDDYGLAEALRSEHGLGFYRASGGPGQSRRGPAQALAPRRVALCRGLIANAPGTLEAGHVILSENSTKVAVTWRPDAAKRRSGRRERMLIFGTGTGTGAGGGVGPPQPSLTDDRGTTSSSEFQGGGSDEEWEGELTASQPLACDTEWIELDGTRIELIDDRSPCQVSIESLPQQAAAPRYLWRRLAVSSHFHEPPQAVERAIDALLAARALQADDPVVGQVRVAAKAIPRGIPVPAGTVGALPEPWGSLLTRRGREDGPQGVIVLGTVTPLFDGFSVAALMLESGPDGFELKVEVVPGLEGHRPFGATLQSGALAWWASDDRDNHYLGSLENWNGDDEHCAGDISFWPALDPKAGQLRIMPTGERNRAVISVPLPWAGQAPAGVAEPA